VDCTRPGIFLSARIVSHDQALRGALYTARVIPGVILAAGRSERMGRPKALLPCGPDGTTFVRRLAVALCDGGAEEALVVGRPDDEALRAEVLALPVRARYVENPNADEGQLSSLLAGLSAADRPGVSGVLVAPVDAPLIAAATVAALLDEFRATRAPIVRAVHHGRHGHPVLFGREMFDALRRADPAAGARAVLRAHADRLVNVDVDDPGVLGDVDTPADYRALRDRDF
jgi:molybdenum cofactor cytidylyltransferase